MKLIADSGSTKTEWCLIDGKKKKSFYTQGLSPYFLNGAQIEEVVTSELKNKLKDGVLFGVQDMGRGNIVFLADDVLFRSFWENGKLMLCNAVFLVGQ